MPKKPTAGIILAAGQSIRFGQPKQLVELKGQTLIQKILETALKSKLDKCILVLGFEHKKIMKILDKWLQDPRIQIVINHDFKEGQSRSLNLGLSAVKDEFPSVMFMVADQPMLDADTIDYLLEKFWHSSQNICVPVCEGQRRNPTIFSSSYYDRLLQIDGDTGARQLIASHPEDVLSVELSNTLCFFDIDTPQDLAELNSLMPQEFN